MSKMFFESDHSSQITGLLLGDLTCLE